MFDDVSPPSPKVPLDTSDEEAVQRLGRWMRVVGSIQLAFSALGLAIVLFWLSCGVLAAGPMGGGGMVLLLALIPAAAVAVFLVQSLRIQAAGEQFKNLGDEHDVDYLELAFARLKTVYIIDVVLGVLVLISNLGGAQ
jgi:hypothetical protein